MAILQCSGAQCGARFVAPADVPRCPWCHARATVVLEAIVLGSHSPADDQLAQQQLLIERLTAALFGPGLRDDERVRNARQLLEDMAPRQSTTPNERAG